MIRFDLHPAELPEAESEEPTVNRGKEVQVHRDDVLEAILLSEPCPDVQRPGDLAVIHRVEEVTVVH